MAVSTTEPTAVAAGTAAPLRARRPGCRAPPRC